MKLNAGEMRYTGLVSLYPSGGSNGPARQGRTDSLNGLSSSGTAPGGISNEIPNSSQEITAPSVVTSLVKGEPKKCIPGNCGSMAVAMRRGIKWADQAERDIQGYKFLNVVHP